MKVAQSCLTFCDPTDNSVHGILQARILEWVAFPFSRGSSQPRSPALQADSLPAELPGKPYKNCQLACKRVPLSLELACCSNSILHPNEFYSLLILPHFWKFCPNLHVERDKNFCYIDLWEKEWEMSMTSLSWGGTVALGWELREVGALCLYYFFFYFN